jgi:hypothetical protein
LEQVLALQLDAALAHVAEYGAVGLRGFTGIAGLAAWCFVTEVSGDKPVGGRMLGEVLLQIPEFG